MNRARWKRKVELANKNACNKCGLVISCSCADEENKENNDEVNVVTTGDSSEAHCSIPEAENQSDDGEVEADSEPKSGDDRDSEIDPSIRKFMVTHYNRNNDSDESEDITQVNTPGDDSMSDVGTEHDPDEEQVNGNGERKEPRSTPVDKESPKPANNNKMPSSDKKRSAVSNEENIAPWTCL